MKRSVRSQIKIFGLALLPLFALFATTQMCFGQKLLLVARDEMPNRVELELAARFYGVQVQAIRVTSPSDANLALDRIRNHDVQGVVASADSLSAFSRTSFLSALRRGGDRAASMLVVGIQPGTDKVLQEWSARALTGCTSLSSSGQRQVYQVGPDPEVTLQLSNEELPVLTAPGCGLQTAAQRNAFPLLSVVQGNASVPVFVRTGTDSLKTFFLANWNSAFELENAQSNLVGTFSSLAPFLMFVRYAVSDFGWHSPRSVANFTIDDPWLTEPYGYLSYRTLLQEMEKHNFHTTIAFIPWNFDRSQPEVITLFRDHSDRFSIAIHGNNHDHKEFDDYATIPLVDQVADIKQSLARMEKFHTLTGVSYDRVMVFPHSIAPEGTLGELKKYNFLATSNGDDVPLGSRRPTDPLFCLRSYTSEFGNFPSLKRYSAEVLLPRIVVAVNAFLGNPLLFYGHAVMFDQGSQVFDGLADTVNRIAPGTEWDSLGSVAEHLYLVRSRTDGGIDLKFFGNDVVIDNPSSTERVFWLQKQDNAEPAIKALSIDGQTQTFERTGNEIAFQMAIPAHSSKQVSIEYANDLNLAQIATSDPNARITFLRNVSDFRDIVLPKYRWGRWITHFYYRHRLDSLEIDMESWWFGLVFITVLATIFLFLHRRRASKTRANKTLARAAGVSK